MYDLPGVVSPSSPTTPSAGGVSPSVPGGGMVRDSPMLLQQITDLKAALHHTTTAMHSNTAQHMHSQLASLKPIRVTTMMAVREILINKVRP